LLDNISGANTEVVRGKYVTVPVFQPPVPYVQNVTVPG